MLNIPKNKIIAQAIKVSQSGQMNKILVVSVKEGLCNRLRVLLSAIAYSEVTNRQLLIDWPQDRVFGAALSDLWQHPYQEIGSFSKRILLGLAGGYYTHDSIHLGIKHPIACVKTVHTFCEQEYPAPLVSYLSRLSLIEPLQEKIETFASQWFDGHVVVGVSIRYHNAHAKTLAASPPEWFIQRLNEIHAQFPNVRFFLSVDCNEISQYIRSATKAVICQLPRNYHVNQTDGIQEAVCELYLLARTNYILASYWSSFANMACSMRGESAYENSQSSPSEAVISRYLRSPTLV